jgi:hypothetical protein
MKKNKKYENGGSLFLTKPYGGSVVNSPFVPGQLPDYQMGSNVNSGVIQNNLRDIQHYYGNNFPYMQEGGDMEDESGATDSFYTNKLNGFIDKVRGAAQKNLENNLLKEAMREMTGDDETVEYGPEDMEMAQYGMSTRDQSQNTYDDSYINNFANAYSKTKSFTDSLQNFAKMNRIIKPTTEYQKIKRKFDLGFTDRFKEDNPWVNDDGTYKNVSRASFEDGGTLIPMFQGDKDPSTVDKSSESGTAPVTANNTSVNTATGPKGTETIGVDGSTSSMKYDGHNEGKTNTSTNPFEGYTWHTDANGNKYIVTAEGQMYSPYRGAASSENVYSPQEYYTPYNTPAGNQTYSFSERNRLTPEFREAMRSGALNNPNPQVIGLPHIEYRKALFPKNRNKEIKSISWQYGKMYGDPFGESMDIEPGPANPNAPQAPTTPQASSATPPGQDMDRMFAQISDNEKKYFATEGDFSDRTKKNWKDQKMVTSDMYDTPEKVKEAWDKKVMGNPTKKAMWDAYSDMPPALKDIAADHIFNSKSDPRIFTLAAAGAIDMKDSRKYKDDPKLLEETWNKNKDLVNQQYNDDPQAFTESVSAHRNIIYSKLRADDIPTGEFDPKTGIEIKKPNDWLSTDLGPGVQYNAWSGRTNNTQDYLDQTYFNPATGYVPYAPPTAYAAPTNVAPPAATPPAATPPAVVTPPASTPTAPATPPNKTLNPSVTEILGPDASIYGTIGKLDSDFNFTPINNIPLLGTAKTDEDRARIIANRWYNDLTNYQGNGVGTLRNNMPQPNDPTYQKLLERAKQDLAGKSGKTTSSQTSNYMPANDATGMGENVRVLPSTDELLARLESIPDSGFPEGGGPELGAFKQRLQKMYATGQLNPKQFQAELELAGFRNGGALHKFIRRYDDGGPFGSTEEMMQDYFDKQYENKIDLGVTDMFGKPMSFDLSRRGSGVNIGASNLSGEPIITDASREVKGDSFRGIKNPFNVKEDYKNRKKRDPWKAIRNINLATAVANFDDTLGLEDELKKSTQASEAFADVGNDWGDYNDLTGQYMGPKGKQPPVMNTGFAQYGGSLYDNLKQGDEVYLTQEQIDQLLKRGVKLSYLD